MLVEEGNDGNQQTSLDNNSPKQETTQLGVSYMGTGNGNRY